MIYSNTFLFHNIQVKTVHTKCKVEAQKKATKVHVIRSVGSH